MNGRPGGPSRADADDILRAIRRIIRAVDHHSRHLVERHGVTVGQLACLHRLQDAGPLSTGEVGRSVEVSPGTLTGILDRLERKGWVRRERQERDRRVVTVRITRRGQRILREAPPFLQARLQSRLRRLGLPARRRLLESLDQILSMMGWKDPEAAPILEIGPLVPSRRGRSAEATE